MTDVSMPEELKEAFAGEEVGAGDEAFYDSELDFAGPMPIGDYPAHIIKVDIATDVAIPKSNPRNLTDIYNPWYRIAEEAEGMTFQRKDKEGNITNIPGKKLVGKEQRGDGVFRYKNPAGEPRFRHLKDNRGGNRRYRDFVSYLDIPMEEASADGKKLFRLPRLSEADMIGRPIMIRIYHTEWVGKDGITRTAAKAIPIGPWHTGGHRDAGAEDIPF